MDIDKVVGWISVGCAAAALLCGCGEVATVNKWELVAAEKFCSNRDGIDYVRVRGNAYVRCVDGSTGVITGKQAQEITQ